MSILFYFWKKFFEFASFFQFWTRMAVRYGTLVRYASILAKKYSTLVW